MRRPVGDLGACIPLAPDVLVNGQPAFRACAVDRAARLQSQPRLLRRYTPTGNQACGRIVVEFAVDTAGKPVRNTARVVRSNDPGLTEAVMAGLPEMRYSPAIRDGQKVSQLVEYTTGYAVRTVVVRAGSQPPPRTAMPRGGPAC